MQKNNSSRGSLRTGRAAPRERIIGIVEPPEEVFREVLLSAFWKVQGMEIDDVFPANRTARDEVHR